MTIPPYIEAGTLLKDATGHDYRADHSGDCDEWGNPKIMLVDLNPGLDGIVAPAEWTVPQLVKLRFTVAG